MVILYSLYLVGKAESRRELDLILGLVLPVPAAALGAYEIWRGQGRIVGDLVYIVEDAVLIDILRNIEFISILIAEAEGHARIHDRLTVQNVLEKLLGYVDIRKDLKVGTPFYRRAGLFAVSRAHRELLTLFADDLAFFEMKLVFIAVSPYGDIHIFRGILCRTGSQTI